MRTDPTKRYGYSKVEAAAHQGIISEEEYELFMKVLSDDRFGFKFESKPINGNNGVHIDVTITFSKDWS